MGVFQKKSYALGVLLSVICAYKACANETVITSLADNGFGSLRDAMLNAQDGDFLIFDKDLSGTIVLESDLPSIASSYSIQGPDTNSVTIDGASLYQIFTIESGNSSISHLQLVNPELIDGGAVYLQAGVSLNLVDTSISRSDLNNNKLIEVDAGSTFSMQNPSIIHYLGGETEADLLALPDSTILLKTDAFVEAALVFEGSSSVVKQGEGILKLFTTTTQDLALSVHEGALIFNGSTLGSINVQKNGFLGGTHSCLSLVNDGTIKPGNSIGIIQIAGDYNQSGTLQIELSPIGASDLLQIGGNAFLDGSLVLIPQEGLYLKGDSFTILTTEGNIQGHFSDISSIIPGLDFSVLESAQSIQVNILQNSIALHDAELIGNSLSTLDLFQNASARRDSDIFSVLSALNKLDGISLEGALNQLNPDSLPAIYWSEATTLYQIVNAASQPFNYCDEFCEQMENVCCPPRRPNRFWTKAVGERTAQNRMNQLPGFRTYAGGILIGYDQKIESPVTLGGYAAYMRSDFQWNDPDEQGKARINGYNGSLYTSICSKKFQFDFSLLGSFFQQEIQRYIAFDGFHRTAYSSPDGYAILGHFGSYGIFPIGSFFLSPFGKFDYISIWQNGLHEHGAGSIDLIVPSTHWQFAHAEAGLYSSGRFCFSWGTMVPSVSLSWVYFGPIFETDISGQLVGIPQVFNVQTSNHKFNGISPMIELGFIVGNQAWISAAYKGEFSVGRTEQDVNFNFRWQF